MKKSFASLLIIAISLGGVANNVFAQADAGLVSGFLNTAQSASDSQLGSIASELTGKMQSLNTATGTNSTVAGKLDSTLKSLTGGEDSAALSSAFKLASSAKLTPEQLGLAKQVGNLASAYVMQKNFATLDGSQGDVATIVSSLRSGKIKDALPSLKNVASSAKLSDTQKQLIATIADKYAPGLSKASGALDSLKKLPGF
ncbi:MAG TPA: hypothetical protein VIK62_04700 [Verrucomicrobiae bacterium]